MNKVKIVFNKHIYIEISVLDLSKHLMYDVMKPTYEERVKILCMDIKSFMHNIETDYFYEDMKSMIDNFDTCNYQENN